MCRFRGSRCVEWLSRPPGLSPCTKTMLLDISKDDSSYTYSISDLTEASGWLGSGGGG